MHPHLLTLQHSSFLVTSYFTLFNFLLFFLTLFLLCNLPHLIQPLHHLPPLNTSSCLVIHHHSPPCILPLLHPPSPTHHPLKLSSLPLPPLQPLCLLQPLHPMHPPLQPSSFLTTPHPSCLLQPLPPLYSPHLNPSSSFVTHRFTIFNFFLLILILFLLLQLSSPHPNPLPPSSTSSSSATFLVSLLHHLSPSSSLFSSFPFFF